MHIESICIHNFRGFRDLTLSLHPQLSVFIGINGSGKSSILDAIALVLSNILQQKFRVNALQLSSTDLHVQAKEVEITIQLSMDLGIEQFEVSYQEDGVFGDSWNGQASQGAFFEDLLRKSQQESNTSYPLLAYYPTSRMFPISGTFAESTKTSQKILFPQIGAYEGAFTNDIADFRDFTGWFREEEDFENELKLHQDSTFVNPSLQVIRIAIQTFFNSLEKHHTFSNLRVRRVKLDGDRFSHQSIKPSLTIDKDGVPLTLERLSSGEKTTLILVADLARRLAISNPAIADGEQVLAGKGIVLIDEVDLHLHPQWQRNIVPALQKTFPGFQFIITCHSPLVLSQVSRESVFILENFQVVANTPHTRGRDSNSILYELMNVSKHPPETQAEIDRCLRLIDEEKYEEAKVELQALGSLLGENDVEVVRANALTRISHNDKKNRGRKLRECNKDKASSRLME